MAGEKEMKTIGILIVLVIFLSFSPLFAQEEPKYVLVEREKLEKMREWIVNAQKYMDELLTENVALEAENGALQAQLESYKKGLFIGGNVGLPLGGDAMVLYQFDKNGIYTLAGYNNGWNIHIGYVRKIR